MLSLLKVCSSSLELTLTGRIAWEVISQLRVALAAFSLLLLMWTCPVSVDGRRSVRAQSTLAGAPLRFPMWLAASAYEHVPIYRFELLRNTPIELT